MATYVMDKFDYGGNTYKIDYSKTYIEGTIHCGSTAIVAGNIIVGKDGAYHHLKLGTAFDINYPILYASTAIAANGNSSEQCAYLITPFTITTTQNITLTTNKPVYIKGTLQGNIFTPISTAPLTQTVPTAVDNYDYILLGYAVSTTVMYLIPEHPIYKLVNYDGASMTFLQTNGVNDNSFYSVHVESNAGATSSAVSLTPSKAMDTLSFVEGDNVNLQGDFTTNKITVSATNYWHYNSDTDSIDLIFPD